MNVPDQVDGSPQGERVAQNESLNAAISTAANATSFADRLAERGVTTVFVDASGGTVSAAPDGTTEP